MLQILIYVFLILYALHFYFNYRRMGRILNMIPGPPGVPLFGNIIELFSLSKSNIWEYISMGLELFYPVCKLSGLNLGGVLISEPEDIEILLNSTKHIEKSFIYMYLKSWLRDGLLTSKGTKWIHRRKMLTPAFHFNVLQKYVDIMREHGQKMVDDIKSHNKAVTIKLTPFLTKYTLSIICETAMGTPLNDNDGGKSKKYRNAIYEIGEIVVDRFFNVWNPLVIYDKVFNNFTRMGWRHRQVLKTLHDFSTNIINERKEYHNQTNGVFLKTLELPLGKEKLDNEMESDLKTKKKRLAMLDILISAQRRNEIDDLGIREEVDTFVFEGHDTSAAALTFSIQLLAQHANIQAKAREEVNSIWNSCDGKIGMTELNQMYYLERCIKETLRLFPSVVFLSRQLNDDMKLKNYLVPAGSTAACVVYDLHRNPRHWPDPLKFDPDRFLPENCVNRHAYAYIPFSAGPRNCIGQKFALLELKMMCAYVLRSFNMEAIERFEDFERSPDLILRPQKDIHVKFIPVESKL